MIMSCEKIENHFLLSSSVWSFPFSPPPSVPQPRSNGNTCLEPLSKLWHILLPKPQKEGKGIEFPQVGDRGKSGRESEGNNGWLKGTNVPFFEFESNKGYCVCCIQKCQ